MKNPLSLEARIWSAGILNVIFLGLQIIHILQVRSVAGISIISSIGFLFIQITFAQLGWKTNDKGLFWGMSITAVLSLILLFLLFYFR